jgi:hypothetical protein
MAQTYIDQNGVERDMATGKPYLAITKRTNSGVPFQSVSSGGGSGGRTFQQAAQQPVQPKNLPVLNSEPQVGPGVLTPQNPGANTPAMPSPYLDLQRPDLNIGTNEMLMRVGGAGMRGAQQGGLESMAAMADTYGGIQDQRRTNALAGYNSDLAQAKAEQAAIDAQAKAEADIVPEAAPAESPYLKATLDAIESIEQSVAEGENDWLNPFDNVTGLIGGGLALIPGTPAYDTNAQIETVISSIGFDRLQKMRDESPTGGALGQVSERELAQLNASLGNLRQSQSRGSFKRNLANVKKHYLSATEAIRKQQEEYARKNGLPVPSSASNSSSVPSTVGQSSNIGGVTVTRIK